GRRANTCKRAGTRSRSSAASTGPRRRTGTTASWITAKSIGDTLPSRSRPVRRFVGPRETLISGGPSGLVAEPSLDVRIRPARPSDFSACARLCLRSLRDLSRRQGQRPPTVPVRSLFPFLRHALATDPDGFHVAIVRGKIVCYAITILRGRTHFLSQFFARPRMQSRGVGRPVLARAFDTPRIPRGTV